MLRTCFCKHEARYFEDEKISRYFLKIETFSSKIAIDEKVELLWELFIQAVLEGLTSVGKKLPALRPKMVIRALGRGGFYVHHVSGSHYILKKGGLRVTVPYHGKDLKPGTLASIVAQAGLTAEEFLDLL